MTQPKYPNITAFANRKTITAVVKAGQDAMQNAGLPPEEINNYLNQALARDVSNAIEVTNRYVWLELEDPQEFDELLELSYLKDDDDLMNLEEEYEDLEDDVHQDDEDDEDDFEFTVDDDEDDEDTINENDEDEDADLIDLDDEDDEDEEELDAGWHPADMEMD